MQKRMRIYFQERQAVVCLLHVPAFLYNRNSNFQSAWQLPGNEVL